ncbi:MAG: M24 family metallopeptidase [Hyphomicrobiaceae bacterium]
MDIDWHGERSRLDDVRLLDRSPSSGEVDQRAVRAYRLARVRAEMTKRNIAALILNDPVNIRYATGTRNMQIFTSRNSPSRYLLLTLTAAILYEFTGCMHLADGIETISELRPAITASFVASGPGIAERERHWAKEMAATLVELIGQTERVGMERFNAGAAIALAAEGIEICDAQEAVERARAIKSEDELTCIRASIRATERAVHNLREAIRPGLTETELWSVLHQRIIAQNGYYVETRLLNSGTRTNPWFQEASSRVIGTNELIALDTDVVGCYGYYCDFSRTFHSGPGKPTNQQRELYKTAMEQVRHNIDILRPGLSLSEYAEQAWNIPEKFFANRYYLSAHGTGMTGEYPYLYHRLDFPSAGYDGIIEPNMTICVESYIGEEGGP